MKLQEPGAEDYDILEKALKIWILYGRMQDGATPQKVHSVLVHAMDRIGDIL